jgi:hypothetical protein
MFCVSCEGAMIAFLSVSASSSLPEEGILRFRLVAAQLYQMYCSDLRAFFCDVRAGAGVSITVTALKT